MSPRERRHVLRLSLTGGPALAPLAARALLDLAPGERSDLIEAVGALSSRLYAAGDLQGSRQADGLLDIVDPV